MIVERIDAKVEKTREANVIFEFARLLHLRDIRFTLEKTFRLGRQSLRPDLLTYDDAGNIISAIEFKGFSSLIPTEIEREKRWRATRQGLRYAKNFPNMKYICGPFTFEKAYLTVLALHGKEVTKDY